MIAFIRGRVAAWEEDGLTVEINGLGVAVAVPFSQLTPRPAPGEEIFLHTYLQVREDAWVLYGFTDKEQLRIFRMLLNISGVGAKTALAIVDKLGATRLAAAAAAQDIKSFTSVPGVGKKTAERILLELKDKFPALSGGGAGLEAAAAEEALNRDLVAALRQLGYSATEARSFALQAQQTLGGEAGAEILLREALKIAMKS